MYEYPSCLCVTYLPFTELSIVADVPPSVAVILVILSSSVVIVLVELFNQLWVILLVSMPGVSSDAVTCPVFRLEAGKSLSEH